MGAMPSTPFSKTFNRVQIDAPQASDAAGVDGSIPSRCIDLERRGIASVLGSMPYRVPPYSVQAELRTPLLYASFFDLAEYSIRSVRLDDFANIRQLTSPLQSAIG